MGNKMRSVSQILGVCSRADEIREKIATRPLTNDI